MAPPQNDPTHGFWMWSLPIGRVFGIEVRVHWTLLALTAFQVAGMSTVAWWWYPLALLVLPLSVLLHEFGHALTSRAVGGDSRNIILWAYGGIAWCVVPPRILAHFLVAAGGPAVNLAIWASARLLLPALTSHDVIAIVNFIAVLNLSLLLFNLLPCYPMDGGRIARSLLWGLVGRRRAVDWTVKLAYLCLLGMALWAVKNQDFFLFGLAAILLFAVFAEHRQVRMGIDPELGDDIRGDDRDSAWQRWNEARVRRDAERAELRMASEQAELDRLLAKVTEHGLPSLTGGERRTLQRISQRERERSGRT